MKTKIIIASLLAAISISAYDVNMLPRTKADTDKGVQRVEFALTKDEILSALIKLVHELHPETDLTSTETQLVFGTNIIWSTMDKDDTTNGMKFVISHK